MKNTFKIFGIIAFVAVIGFSFTACEEDEGFDRDGIYKTITVIGLPVEGTEENYFNKYAYIGLGTTGKGDIAAVSVNTRITSSSLTLDLYNASGKDENKRFDGKGSFMVIFTITETSDAKSEELFSGYLLSQPISQENTIISFGAFYEFD
ncbi:MAG: hypothetical protein LBH97_00125 [Treponema sp.]|jgi:hypothetical protein|nr:hypothetical protein [Treponema sp.]